jgi:hypothetical protein
MIRFLGLLFQKSTKPFLGRYRHKMNVLFSIYNKKAMDFTMYMLYFSVLIGVCNNGKAKIFPEQHEPKK